MFEYMGTILCFLLYIELVITETPVITLEKKSDCTTYALVHNVLEIEWYANRLLNCTVYVDTIKSLAEYEYLCIKPKTLYFPKCVAMVTVYEEFVTNHIMTRSCYNKLEPTFCTSGNNPFMIKFEAKWKTDAHVVFRVQGKNGEYNSEMEDDEDDSENEGLATQIVLAVATVTTLLAIIVCILVSCRHSRYRNCDSSSERSLPRTIQTEVGEGEITRHPSAPELDSLMSIPNRQRDSVDNEDERETPPPPYWDVVDSADSTVKS